MKLSRFFIFGLCAIAAFPGCINYRRQHKRNFKHELRRDGRALELRGEEPRYHEKDPFPPTMNWWASQKLMVHAPSRILIMPVTNPWNNPQITENVTRILTRELTKAGITDVMPLYGMNPENNGVQWPWSRWPDPFQVGQVKYPELAEAAERFQADAVLYGRITVYKASEPPNIGFKGLLVKIGQPPCCEVLWAMDVVLDAGDTEIWERALQYYHQRTAKHWAESEPPEGEPHGGTRHFGHRLMLVSIDRYLEYCSYEIVKNLRISSRGVLWPHYAYEKKVSPKGEVPTYEISEEDFSEVTEGKDEKKLRKGGKSGGEGRRGILPPYLRKELPSIPPPAQTELHDEESDIKLPPLKEAQPVAEEKSRGTVGP